MSVKLTRRGDAPAIGVTNAEVEALKADLDFYMTELNRERAERDNAIKTWRIMDACRQHAEEECDKLRAALRPCIEIIEANVEFDDEIHEIINEARRALEGK